MCEVTSANFGQLLPLITEQLDKSCFLALDTEFSAINDHSPGKTLREIYQQRSDSIKQITVFQFGLAIFSKTSHQHRYHVDVYNFYLHPTSVHPIDVKYTIQSSSIKFLSEYQFDFNKCFYSGISFLNWTQQKRLVAEKQQCTRLALNERQFLNGLLEKINQWLITARLGDQMEYELNHQHDSRDILDDYFVHSEVRRCFKTVWTTIKSVDKKKILVIEHISKETFEEKSAENNDDFQAFIQSLIGFTQLIRYISDSYRKPIIGHNCFLDWLIIYDKFIDTLPSKFEDFQASMNKTFPCPIFDTKYLASQMKEHLFTRQNRSNISTYVENFTTSTSLASLYTLLTSKYYENLIFLKPTVEIDSTDRYKHEVWTHEAGYDAYMSGVIFLKLIYLYKQKKVSKVDFHDHPAIFDICLNDIQPYKNRFYAILLPYIPLNRHDVKQASAKRSQQCLVIEKHNREPLDMSDIVSRFDAYGVMEYELSRNGKTMHLRFQSEHCQRRILRDYLDHAVYKIEEFRWFKHSSIIQNAFSISIVLAGICLCFLVKRRM